MIVLPMRRAEYQRVVHEHVTRAEMGVELGNGLRGVIMGAVAIASEIVSLTNDVGECG